jgi:Predicted solute binding protein
MTPKQFFAICFIALIVVLPVLAFSPFASAQSGTNKSGLITSDEVWTKAGSPYSLTGPVAVNQGVTLTIQPGVTVNFNSYYLRVNGTLTAIGTSADKITLNSAQIVFTALSNGWSEQTGSGCIIQYAIINQAPSTGGTTYPPVSNSNPIKIDSCTINCGITVNSAIVTNNVVTGNINCQGPLGDNQALDTSTISNNHVKGDILIGGVSLGAVSTPHEAVTVCGNTVEGSIVSGSPEGTPQIYNNIVSSGGIGCDGLGHIYNNTVYGCQTGISLYTMRVFGGNLPCYAVVENNYVTICSTGIGISLSDVHGGLGQQYCPTIQNNTVAGNTIGISLSGAGYTATPIMRYNNLQGNANYTFYLQESNNPDMSLNWWGTTDDAAIARSIYDFNDDFNLGTVTYQPILTAANPNAPKAAEIAPTASPTPTPATQTPTAAPSTSASTTQPTSSSSTPASTTDTPSVSPIIPELTIAITLTAIIAITATAIVHRKNRTKTSR